MSLDKKTVKCYNVLYFWANYAQIRMTVTYVEHVRGHINMITEEGGREFANL